ncbi:MAG: DNA repair protein RecN [Deltaproteobacteria bacterium]
MVSHITIRNFGLIDELSLDLPRGLTILTGETGAGKSILIDGLRYALGERLNTSQVRDPKSPCLVEAVFELTPGLLEDYPPAAELAGGETSLIIQRTYLPDGKSRVKINGLSVTVGQLKELGDHLLDFHGPNDHQMLLSETSHLFIIDRLSGTKELREEYARLYGAYAELLRERQRLQELASAKQRDIELFAHQIKELEQVPLEEEKYAVLLEKQARLDNLEKLHESCRAVIDALENDESGIARSLSPCFPHLRSLAKLDPSTDAFLSRLSSIQEQAGGLLSELKNYLEGLSLDEEEAGLIHRQCDIYDAIKRKYGPGLDEAKKFYEETKARYNAIVNYEETSKGLEGRIDTAAAKARECAQMISRKRKAAAKELKKTIERELVELGIRHVEFECRFEKTELTPEGIERAVFYISPNAGETLKPLADIVSSGEAARLMLALKKALVEVDPIPVLVFDEIDAQIGGRLGTVTGSKLKDLTRNRQVIVITHLPQIAAFADAHFKVTKKVVSSRTVTGVERLGEEETVKELAKMMSGEKESAIALTHAREMLEKARPLNRR